jgi:hypothetical protein
MDSNNPICKQIDESLDAFHDGELSAAEVAVVEEHVKTCSHCAAKLIEIRQVVAVLQTMPRADAPGALSSKLDSLIDQQSKVLVFRRRALRTSAAVAAAAVVVLGLRGWAPGMQDKATVATLPDKPNTTIANSTPSATTTMPKTLMHERGTEVETKIAIAPKAVVLAKKDYGPPPVKHDSDTPNPTIAQRQPDKQTIAMHSNAPANTEAAQDSNAGNEQIAELPTVSNSFTNAVGVATDEDGLYDIQM